MTCPCCQGMNYYHKKTCPLLAVKYEGDKDVLYALKQIYDVVLKTYKLVKTHVSQTNKEEVK